jgi:predicted dehydrogenase
MIRIAVVGAGAWGLNHVRTFARLPGATLTAVCDVDDAARARAAALAPGARLEAKLGDVLDAPDVDAVVLATPAARHADHARAALRAGKHVLVEKPLALRTADAQSVVALAEQAGRTLMVGHLMLHHPAFRKLEQLVADGVIGKVLYAYALRVNLGTLRRDENALWSLAPHDISMLLSLLGGPPETVSARGGCYLQPGVEDVVFVNMRFPSGVIAQVQLSWLDPRKERRLTVVGDRKMVELDDVHPTEKLRIHDKGFDAPPTFTSYAEFLSIRYGDTIIPRVDMAEPLELECRHFLDCIATGATPRTDGRSAIAVVRVLEAAGESLATDGAPVAV